MMTRKKAAEQRRALKRDNDREYKRKERAKLKKLADELRVARTKRKEMIRDAKARCRAERAALKERRKRALEELRAALLAERLAARQACSIQKNEARTTGTQQIERTRAERDAERRYQDELRRIERANRAQRSDAPRAGRAVRRSESDDEVRSNLPPDLVALFNRVKRGIKATSRMSRTEAFLKYAEEHPAEVVAAFDDGAERLIRELEAQQRKASRAAARVPRKALRRYFDADLAAVPF